VNSDCPGVHKKNKRNTVINVQNLLALTHLVGKRIAYHVRSKQQKGVEAKIGDEGEGSGEKWELLEGGRDR